MEVLFWIYSATSTVLASKSSSAGQEVMACSFSRIMLKKCTDTHDKRRYPSGLFKALNKGTPSRPPEGQNLTPLSDFSLFYEKGNIFINLLFIYGFVQVQVLNNRT